MSGLDDYLDQADEDALADAFTTALTQVRSKVVNALVARQYGARGLLGFADEAAHLPSPDDVYSDVWWTDAVNEHVVAQMRTIITAAGLKGSELFAPEGALAQRVLEEHVAQIGSWSDGQRTQIVEVFDRALTEGWSVPRITEALTDSGALSGVAAETAARTEAVAAANGGVIAGWRSDPQTNNGWKRWLATSDGRTRESHNHANGQTVRLTDLFELDAGMGDYPGDPELPPEERVNCRCAVTYLDPNDPDAPVATWGDGEAAVSPLTMSEPTNGGPMPTKIAAADTSTDPSSDTTSTGSMAVDGPVTVEGVRSGDGRVLAAGALEWITPAPLMFLDKTTWGHDDAELAGRLDTFERVATTAYESWDSTSEVNEIVASGEFMDSETGIKARDTTDFMDGYGVSVDVDDATVEYLTDPTVDLEAMDQEELWWWGPPTVQVVTKGRIVGATLCPFPAFQEARMRVVASDGALVASGIVPRNGRLQLFMPCEVKVDGNRFTIKATAPTRDEVRALVASGARGSQRLGVARERKGFYQGEPPADWFTLPKDLTEAYPWTVDKDGHCHGFVALWGQRHISFTGQWIETPKARDEYRHACNKGTWVKGGTSDKAWTTAVYVNGGFHAPTDVPMTGEETQRWYADNAVPAADVALYDTPLGIYATGAVRPDCDAFTLRELSSSDISPDWRPDRGGLTCYSLLAVGTSGYVVPANGTNKELALVASGVRAREHGGQRAQERIAVRDGEVIAAQGLGRVPRDRMSTEMVRLAGEVAWLKQHVSPMVAERAKAELARRFS